MKIQITFLWALLIFANVSAQKNKKDYSEAINLVEVWLEAQKDYDQLPGISVAVVEDQEVLWSGAYGQANLEDDLDMETSTLCSICSISKLFTSIAIMKLYEEGKLRLDTPVKEVLPSYNLTQKYDESGPITIRSLLTHSSGLPREAGYPYWTGPDFPFPSKEQIKAKLSEQETLYPASTYFQYSNLGLTLLGQIVEEITGMPYDEYVQKNILDPLGLSNTRPKMPKDLYGKQLAIGYGALTRQQQREKINFFEANGILPAAGFSSNVADLARFASWQFRLRDTTIAEVLKPSTLKYMQQVHWTNPNWKTTWGLGFVVYKGGNGNTWVGHGGYCPGYRSSLQLDLKSKLAFAVMINAGGTNPGKYVRGINAILTKIKPSSGEQKTEEQEVDL
ncbi:MAG: serine hydrolase domain-containing protein, partial [Flavobacteriaceae bacterium]